MTKALNELILYIAVLFGVYCIGIITNGDWDIDRVFIYAVTVYCLCRFSERK